MKRKEYYLIGRVLLLMGYVFFMLSAILDEWMPLGEAAKRTDGLFALLNCWAVLIPVGFLIVGIATRRKSGIVCAVLALLCSCWPFLGLLADEDGAVSDAIGAVIDQLPGWLVFLLAAMLYTGVVAIAAIRVFAAKRVRAFAVVLGVVTLLLWLFYVVSVMGIVDTGKLFAPVRNAIFRWRNTEDAVIDDEIDAIAGGVYIALASLATICCFTENFGNPQADITKR